MGLEMVKCIKRKGKIEKIYNSKNNSEEEKIVFFEEEKFGGWCDSFVNNNIEDANQGEWYLFSEDDKGEEWYKEWKFYYNHPFSLTDLKALTECVLQLDGTQSEYKLDLIKKLALCSGEKLVNNYIDSIKETNPNYAAVLKEYEYGIREETKDENLDEKVPEVMRESEENENSNDIILELYQKGESIIEIAKQLGLGVGEVKLVIDLYRGEEK